MGFLFDIDTNIVDKKKKLAKSFGCKVCTLNNSKVKNMNPTGASHPIIYIIGEAPGQTEIEQKRQFVGDSGKILRNVIEDVFETDEYDDFIRWNNIVKCRPVDGNSNRTPTKFEMDCCLQSTLVDIEKTKPEVVVGVGGTALSSIIDGNAIGMWRGRFVPIKVGSHVCWFYPIYHPSFLLRKGFLVDDEYVKIFIMDMYNLRNFIEDEGKEPPKFIEKGYEKNIKIITTSIDDVKKELIRISNYPLIGLDIETRGRGKNKDHKIRPYNKDSIIATIAVGTHDDTIVFPVEHPKGFDKEKIKKILYNFILNSGNKIVHNLKFELEWLFHYFNYDKNILFGTEWEDTMGQAYTLDERTSKGEGMLNLDVLIKLNFGFNLKVLSNINKDDILKNNYEELLLYNGMDTKYTHLLFMEQNKKLESEGLVDVYRRRVETSKTITISQARGFFPSKEVIFDFNKKMNKNLDKINKEVSKLPEIIKYESKGKKFSITSSDNLREVFKASGYPNIKPTPTGLYSTDDNVLTELATKHKSKLATYVAEHRKISKLLSTYVDGTTAVIFDDGLVHPNFNMYFTTTGRLSSSKPNMQNYPSREDKEIRNIFIAPDGYYIAAFDFGQIEARLIGMKSKDEVYCKQIWEDFDIHKFWALKVIEYSKKYDFWSPKFEDLKAFRNDCKTNVVFASFYGAKAETCAYRLGIPDEIMIAVQDEFWKTYAKAKIYQEELGKFYDTHGYVETPLGIRRHGPMSVNEYSNAPIQGGAAYDIVLTSGDRLAKLSWELKKPQYNYNINIHDDLTFLLPEESLEEDILFIAKEMTRPAYDFITVPLAIELKIGKSWGDMEEIEVFKTTDFFDYIDGVWYEKKEIRI
jgi:DNA polymerase-1